VSTLFNSVSVIVKRIIITLNIMIHLQIATTEMVSDDVHVFYMSALWSNVGSTFAGCVVIKPVLMMLYIRIGLTPDRP